MIDLFERALCVPTEEFAITLREAMLVPWCEFWLDPRYLRGADFLMRWSQGAWGEERLVEAVNGSAGYYALPYGPSGVAPEEPRELELYFDRLEAAGLDDSKRPDLLVFPRHLSGLVDDAVASLGGLEEIPFVPDDNPALKAIVGRACMAVECENSLWRVKDMPDYGKPLRPMKRLNGAPGMPKTGVVLPTVIVKQEDLSRLQEWQTRHRVPIHIWHVFYDMAFGIALDKALDLIARGHIDMTAQTFQAPSGPTTRKGIYKIYYHHAYSLGEAVDEPDLMAQRIIDKNGHILPYVQFEGGSFRIHDDALDVLAAAAQGVSDANR